MTRLSIWNDLRPFSVGFDDLFDHFNNQLEIKQTSSYPPYNITRRDDLNYQIEMALAGFSKNDLEIKYSDNQDVNLYINFIVEQLFAANKYFNDQEPWKKKNDKLRMNTIIYVALELIRKVTILLYPIIPTSSKKILNIFNYNMDNNKFENFTKLINQNIKINNPEPIFPRILND